MVGLSERRVIDIRYLVRPNITCEYLFHSGQVGRITVSCNISRLKLNDSGTSFDPWGSEQCARIVHQQDTATGLRVARSRLQETALMYSEGNPSDKGCKSVADERGVHYFPRF